MNRDLQLGIVGCDTSHAVAFAKILNDSENEHHVPGAKVTAAFPGGSSDFELSASRVGGFVRELKNDFGVTILDTPEAVAERSDGILLTSADARVHLEQFQRIAAAGKPVFIDKPFTLDSATAREMFRIAHDCRIPLMSCSALRFAEDLVGKLNDTADGKIVGADFYGPMPLQPTQPGYFWYGIHLLEMLFAAFGPGCKEVCVSSNSSHDLVTAVWSDGRIGTIRGSRCGNQQFGGLLHRENGSHFIDIGASGKPYYASLIEQVLLLFKTGKSPVAREETLGIVRLAEVANRSRETGERLPLALNLAKAKRKRTASERNRTYCRTVFPMKTAIITDEVSQELDDVLRFAREFQLDGIEIRSLWNKPPHKLSDDEVKLIKDKCAEAGVEICGIATPVFKCDAENDTEVAEHVEIFERCLELADTWKAPVIRVFTGWRRDNNKELLPLVGRLYREKLLPRIEGKPVVLGVENEYSTNVADGEEAVLFLDEAKSDQVTLVWDPCNILYMPVATDPFDVDYPKVRDRIGHYHVKDAVRVEGGEPPAESVAIGDGKARLKETLNALHADGYRGWVSLETHWRMQEKLGEDVTRSPMGADFSAGAEPASRECMKRLKEWLGELK